MYVCEEILHRLQLRFQLEQKKCSREWQVSVMLTHLLFDSPPPTVAVGAADGSWGLVVMLLLLLLVGGTHLDGCSAFHLFTAGCFLHHRTAVLLRSHSQEDQNEIKIQCKTKNCKQWNNNSKCFNHSEILRIWLNMTVTFLSAALDTHPLISYSTCYTEWLFLVSSYSVL